MKNFKSIAPILLFIFLNTGAVSAHAQNFHSISEWTTCDGKTDDALGVAKAFAAAANGALTLQIDCPVFMHVGMDITRPIFVDSGTTVNFTGKGLIITDNVLIPAFVIANSKNITFNDWNVEYSGGLPIDPKVGGYYDNGTWVSTDPDGHAPPSFAFNDQTLTKYLSTNRGIVFPHGVHSIWHGPTDMSSVFYVIGSSSNININNLNMFAASTSNASYDPKSLNGADKYIPVAFAFEVGYSSNQTAVAISKEDWPPAPNLSVPSNVQFNGVVFNGYYMGFLGVLQNASFNNITGLMYADLMDSNGDNVGGVKKWFAPPHLFYIKYYDVDHPYDPVLSTTNLTITNVNDKGLRSGTARDNPGEKSSGYANSLKLGCVNCSVTGYVSMRPDGLADILSCNHMTLTNVQGTYDSFFLHDLFAGVRFPAKGYYQNLTFNNVSLTDTADNPYSTGTNPHTLPFGYIHSDNDANITFNNVNVYLKQWSLSHSPQPKFSGTGNSGSVKINITG